jgi:hypothetical protein
VNWVEGFPSFTRFAEVGDAALYAPLPEGWHVGVTDVVQSTAAIGVGRYKAVNIAGAAAISALMNALGTRDFPFAFAGDGCAFALPGEAADVAAEALAKTAAWVRDDLGLTLRTALVAVADIRAAGHDVRVAMFRPSEHVGYAMFDGGGVIFAERTMKSGALGIEPAAFGERPDLTGLSCRWLPIAARNGAMLSLIVRPGPASDRRGFGASIAELLELLDEAARSHPVPPRGPDLALVGPGLRLEALASRGRRSLWWRGIGVFAHTLMGWFLFTTGLRVGGFDPPVYRAMNAKNADYRKFSDGLALTIDCDPALEAALGAVLAERAAAGQLVYGLHRQSAALMTCIVPSYADHSHFHFIDGAEGGYAAAARALADAVRDAGPTPRSSGDGSGMRGDAGGAADGTADRRSPLL